MDLYNNYIEKAYLPYLHNKHTSQVSQLFYEFSSNKLVFILFRILFFKKLSKRFYDVELKND